MSAYGGYQKTSYGAQGGDDSGGFFAGGGSQQGSQGGGGGKSYQDESLRPLTIKQILEAEEPYSGADFKVDGAPITQITFVGQVRSINPQQTNLTIKVDDGTGQIDVKKWIDADKQGDAEPGFEIDSHIRVWGRLKSFSNKRHVGAHVIRPVTDFNEVNYHLLEATYVHLFYTRGASGNSGAGPNNSDSMFVDGGDGYNAGAGGAQLPTKLSGCSAAAKRVYNYLNDTPGGSDGMHLSNITGALGLAMREVLTAADELLGLGIIYTTVDDETWAILEY
ncbi:replication factor A2 [Trichoderma harzianum]|uniref:Replication factor A2 n=1 Tax=Trichoderma harzianum TaxID=5544 RepID=A0A0G0AMQ4_TRIHA|nr:replication factor A2 [Trichoderma harzianum]